jgi:tetratricopeptide (TPR) repeat protein
LAKTYVQSERYEKAEATLNLLQSKSEETSFPIEVKKALPLVYADLFLARENYNAAYPYLQRGLELNSKRELVMRIEFILGQINQRDQDFEAASAYYKKVIKRSPPYQMEFQAKMNLAQCYDEGSGESKYINKVLLKMARETKNKDYLDQIYYALAKVAEKDGNDTLSVHYLVKSVSSSTTNKVQKSSSALELADKYFDKNNYKLAQAYYDTAVSSLPKDFPNYDFIKAKTDVLSEIVVHIQVIERQDSLQYLASLDTTALYAIVDGLIAEYAEEQERQAVEKEEMEQGGIQFVDLNQTSRNPNLNTGKWYFYNVGALGFGRSEFKKKWGSRKLEDNWRLSDKKSMMQSFETDLTDESIITAEDSAVVANTFSPRTRGYYLSDIPRTQKEMAVSDSMMIEAYHALGFLYFEELRDSLSAQKTYINFQEKYPDNNYRLESWYALYKIYLAQKNLEESDFYKGLILGNYPESLYANVIRDPDYFIKLSQAKNEAAALYEKAYDAFSKEQYFRTITYADKGVELYPNDTSLVPRFLYLKAMSQGVVDVPDSMYASLYYIAGKYPTNSVGPLVRSVMKTLEQDYGMGYGTKAPVDNDSTFVAPTPYKYLPESTHLIMIVVLKEDLNINALKIRISDFDKKYFQLKNLKVKSLMLDNERSLVTVGNFDNEGESTNYLMALRNDSYVMSGVSSNDFQVYSISMGNYPLFYKDKNLENYDFFWKKNYPQR